MQQKSYKKNKSPGIRETKEKHIWIMVCHSVRRKSGTRSGVMGKVELILFRIQGQHDSSAWLRCIYSLETSHLQFVSSQFIFSYGPLLAYPIGLQGC